MRFSEELRWGELAGKHKAYLMDNLENRRFQPGCYVLTKARYPNLYEIYNAAWFLSPFFDAERLLVVGIGYGYKDAVRLATRMLEERFL